MNQFRKIALIIRREYLTRVKKRSFIIMTILGPILMASIFVVPVWLSSREKPHQDVLVLDKSHDFVNLFESNHDYSFTYSDMSLDKALKGFYKTNYNVIVAIPSAIVEGNNNIEFFYKKSPGIGLESYVQNRAENILYKQKLVASHINPDIIKAAKTKIHIITKKFEEGGKVEQESTTVNMMVGYASAMLIYFFIFLYGVQVMQGVIEEKTNRIVEVIISSVKPFQLMMGKIVGIALVGLTQLALWIVLTFGLYTVANKVFLQNMKQDLATQTLVKQKKQKNALLLQVKPVKSNLTASQTQTADVLKSFLHLDFIDIILCFVFYFLGGYLLYSALFAAVGSAIDDDADKQQFMMPITIPLILAIVMASTVMSNPNGPVAFWASIFPLTSPIIMMVRLPYGVPIMQLLLSMALLILGFLGTTWLAGKIYRTGILMYGKKVSYKELWKWIRYH